MTDIQEVIVHFQWSSLQIYLIDRLHFKNSQTHAFSSYSLWNTIISFERRTGNQVHPQKAPEGDDVWSLLWTCDKIATGSILQMWKLRFWDVEEVLHLSYFSVVVTNKHDLGDLSEKHLVWGFNLHAQDREAWGTEIANWMVSFETIKYQSTSSKATPSNVSPNSSTSWGPIIQI